MFSSKKILFSNKLTALVNTTTTTQAPTTQAPTTQAPTTQAPTTQAPTTTPTPNLWTQVSSDIDGQLPGDRSGYSVSLSNNGNRVAIGSIYNMSSGRVRIYDWNGSSWVQVGSDSDIYGNYYDAEQGISVSLSGDGNRVAVGLPRNDPTLTNAGHVRIYVWNGVSWIQLGSDIDGKNSGEQSGHSVSLSNDGARVAIGSSNFALQQHVRIYDWDGNNWVQAGSDINSEAAGDAFGYSVSLSSDGNRVAIGATHNDAAGENAGHVRIYDWNGSEWNQVGSDVDGDGVVKRFGHSVSLSSNGNRVAIGSDSSGYHIVPDRVRIYEWNSSEWIQVGSYIDGKAFNDRSGWSVSLSSDGSRVAIGTIPSGEKAGYVRIYDWNGSEWNQVGFDIGGSHNYDRSGWSVSLSSDGNRVVIGAPYNNNSSGSQAGHVRIYDYNPN